MSNEYVHEFDNRALARALLVASGVRTGLWRLAAKYRLGQATGLFVNPDKSESRLPSVIAGLDKIAMVPAKEPGPLVYDAAELLSDAGAMPKQQLASSRAPTAAKKPPAKKVGAAKKSARAP